VAALERVAYVVEKLLQLARVEAGLGLSREPVDFGALARVVAGSYLRHSRYRDRVRVQTPASSVFVEGDLDTLDIALQNLVDNALTHGGPDVRVRIVVGDDGSLTVFDDGLGVEAEQLATLHQPFVRGSTAAAGSGLGLSIVAKIVEQSGGSLGLLCEGKSMGFNAILRLRPIGGRTFFGGSA
jgi:two-component system OmpR family sensor kinase